MKRAFAAAAMAIALIWPASVAAALPSWNLTGEYKLEFDNCSSSDPSVVCPDPQPYLHSMTITSSNTITGEVEGFGVNVDLPYLQWTITGTVSGSDVEFKFLFSEASGSAQYNPRLMTGSIDSTGGMSGTAKDSGGARTLEWTITEGKAKSIDRTAPTASFTAVPASPTNAATLSYTVTFSEPVTDLAAGDFTRTGTATGCVVGAPSGSGSSYTVAIPGCSNGTVILALKANSVTDADGNLGPAAVVTAPTVTIDRTTPTASFTVVPATPTNAANLSYTVTFSEPVTGLVGGDFAVTGTATGCVVTPAGSGSSYTVALTGCTGGTVTLALKASSVTDGDGNLGPAANVTAATVTIDRVAPTASSLAVKPRVGAALSGSSVPLAVTWSASDNTGGSGVARYELGQSKNRAAWTTVSTSLTSKSAGVTAASSGTIRYRVRAVDAAGNAGAWVNGITLSPRLTQQTSSSVKYSGTWTKTSSSSFSGGSAKYAKAAGRSASLKFTGRSIALVTTKAPSRGKVKVYVNGKFVTTVDLRGSSTQYRAVAWERTWSTSATRTVKLVLAGTSGRPRVDLDAFVVVK